MPEISVQNRAAFTAATEELKAFSGGVRSNNFSVAIAVLMHSAAAGRNPLFTPKIHPPGSGPPVDTAELQMICDEVYAKESAFLPPAAEGPIYKPFTDSFKPRSPSTNNWRNSFDLQAGLGCDAPFTDDYLRSPTYLGEPRTDCVFRDPATGHCGSPAGVSGGTGTCFNPNKRGVPPGSETRAKVPPKLLARSDSGYWVVPPTEDLLAQLLSHPAARIPVYAYIAATYCGSPYLVQWGDQVDLGRFLTDIGLSRIQASTIFDLDPASAANSRVLQAAGIVIDGEEDVNSPFAPGELHTRPFQFSEPGKLRRTSEASPDPERRLVLLEKAIAAHQTTVSALASLIGAAGGMPLEQLSGFDLYTEIGGVGHLFEVKTWTPRNLHHQLRKAVSQLYEYRWRSTSDIAANTQLYIVLTQEPPSDWRDYLFTYIHGDRGIIPSWLTASTLSTYPEIADALSPLIP